MKGRGSWGKIKVSPVEAFFVAVGGACVTLLSEGALWLLYCRKKEGVCFCREKDASARCSLSTERMKRVTALHTIILAAFLAAFLFLSW